MRIALRLVYLFACLSFLPVAVPQWQRAEVDGRSGCEDPIGTRFTPSYEAKPTVTIACNVLTQLEAWLGGSIAEAQQLLLALPDPPPPPPPDSLPMGWTDVTIDGGVIATWSSVLSYSSGPGEWRIQDTGGNVFGTADHTAAFEREGGVSGDSTLTACVTDADIDGTPVSAKPYLMVRESTNANSANAHIGIRANSGRRFYTRATTGASTVAIAQDTTATVLPWCLRISVDADRETVRAEQSSNGTDFTQLGVDQSFAWLGSTYRVLLSGTANNDGDPLAFNDVTFDSVVFSLAAVDHAATTVSDIPPFPDTGMAGVVLESGRTTVNCSTISCWQSAMAGACKRTIQLAAGTYEGNLSTTRVCSAAQAIIVKGAANHTSVWQNGSFTLEGQHNIIDGLKIGVNAIVYAGGTRNRILRHEQTGWGIPAAIRIMPGEGLEIAYCYMHEPGAWTWDPGEANEFRMGIKMYTPNGVTSSLHKRAWIHHCHFDDFPERPGGNGNFNSGSSDAIEACVANYPWTPEDEGDLEWRIEDNLFTDHKQGDQVIDLKCGGNVFQRNTIKDGPPNRVDFRLGSRNKGYSNYMPIAGFGVRGAFHTLACNYVRGSQSGRGIQINAGNLDAQDTSNASGHPRAEDVLLARNDADAVNVGFDTGSSPASTLAAQRTRIESHTGTVNELLETDTVQVGPSPVLCAEAVELDTDDVGPAKMATAPAAYLAARVAP